tara:strand:+ start:231 stop:437 length:207 start_codon:yes stop_codon:yes gene_type:complete
VSGGALIIAIAMADHVLNFFGIIAAPSPSTPKTKALLLLWSEFIIPRISSLPSRKVPVEVNTENGGYD